MDSPDHPQPRPSSDPLVPDWQAPELRVTAPAPAWFDAALAAPFTSRFVDVEGCTIHYLLWPGENAEANRRGLLFVHGGGAHANWWRFIAPFFTRHFRVAALDLSGMGDSGARPHNDAHFRAREIRSVIADAGLERPFVIGHSFGGFMTTCYGAAFGHEAEGIVIVDSPINRPGPDGKPRRVGRPPSVERYYPSFEVALERFRLMPRQACANDYLVEFIGRHSLRDTPAGWAWKFDVPTMNANRWQEPFHEFLAATRCRAALIYGAKSALVNHDSAAYIAELMGPRAPVVEIPEAHHHLMLDQPLAFVCALRGVLESWVRDAG